MAALDEERFKKNLLLFLRKRAFGKCLVTAEPDLVLLYYHAVSLKHYIYIYTSWFGKNIIRHHTESNNCKIVCSRMTTEMKLLLVPQVIRHTLKGWKSIILLSFLCTQGPVRPLWVWQQLVQYGSGALSCVLQVSTYSAVIHTWLNAEFNIPVA